MMTIKICLLADMPPLSWYNCAFLIFRTGLVLMVALRLLEIELTLLLQEGQLDRLPLEGRGGPPHEAEISLLTEEVMQTPGKMIPIEEMTREEIEEVKGIVEAGEETMILVAKGIMIGKIDYILLLLIAIFII